MEGSTIKIPCDVKAQKHIQLSISIKNLIKSHCPDLTTLLATYTLGKNYQTIEELSGEEFWSLRMYKSEVPNRDSRVKDPDIIVVNDRTIKFIIEVKWGFVDDENVSDLFSIFNDKEKAEILNMLDGSMTCRAIGPKVQRGKRVNMNRRMDFHRDENTKFLLVSDIGNLHVKRNKLYSDMKGSYQSQYGNRKNRPHLLDIAEDVDGFPSLASFLSSVR